MATALHVNGHDLPIDGQVLHVAPGWQTVYVLMATPGPAADAKSIERAAHTVLVSREPLFDGAARVVETFIMPSTQDFYGQSVSGGAWVAGLRFDGLDWPRIVAQLDDLLDAGSSQTTKRGEEMSEVLKGFSDVIRATVPQGTHEVRDAELILIRQTINEALRPLLLQLQDLDSRIRRVVTGIRQPELDVFGSIVRHPGQLTRAEEMAAAKRREQDPFLAAVREKREPLTLGQGHRYYRERKHR